MRVLHVIPSLSPTQGGPSFALPFIERALAEEGVQVTVAVTDDDGTGKRLAVPPGQAVPVNGTTRFFFRKQTEFYKVSYPLHCWLCEHVQEYHLVHIHALFSFSSWSAARAARRKSVPYIIRPLGVLNHWGVKNRRPFLKSLSLRWVERAILNHAAAMHYTSRQEQTEAEQAGATAPPFIIPLGIDLAPFTQLPDVERFFQHHPGARGHKLLLFLSRLDAKKGLDVLLPAFAKVLKAVPNVLLVIAGDGPAGFVAKCRGFAAAAGIADATIWPGFLDGEEKLAAFAAASVFVLPSYSENFGIAAVEALAAGLPCVLSMGVAVSEDVTSGDAGLVVPPVSGPLAEALIRLLTDDVRRHKCAGNARRLAASRFSLVAMGKGLLTAYQEILRGSEGLDHGESKRIYARAV